jgi:hypothetical protein
MELPKPAEPARLRLQQVRETVLALHKSLLESERTAYEITHGPIGSPAAFLNLLINDPAFGWLQPLTTLIVQIDEALAAKRPPSTEQELEQLLGDTRALLSPSSMQGSFWHRYWLVVQRDPAVAVLHAEIEQGLNA